MKYRHGFTLFEVLVALAILSIGVLAAMRALAMVTQATVDLRDRQFATWVAQDRLAEIRALGVFPPIGSSEGIAAQAGQSFKWRLEVSSTPNPLFRRLDVQVFGENGSNVAAKLSGFAVQPLR
jgi:general secretion pathway protein I